MSYWLLYGYFVATAVLLLYHVCMPLCTRGTYDVTRSLLGLRYLLPFLAVVESPSTTGPMTGVALSSLHKFLLYGFIRKDCPRVKEGITLVAQVKIFLDVFGMLKWYRTYGPVYVPWLLPYYDTDERVAIVV